MVVGLESDPYGTVDSNDLDEAETWLNGTEVGVQIVGGHGPVNTQAILGSFVARSLRPTVTLTVKSAQGVRAQADRILRGFFKPHARDSVSGEYLWSFGGQVPIPILFGLLWEGIPSRVMVSVSVTDGVTTYGNGDSVDLDSFELPVLSTLYSAVTDIVINVVS